MLIKIEKLLHNARQNRYALGAFTIYDMETAIGVIKAAEEAELPAILQISKETLQVLGESICCMVLSEAESSRIPIAVQLDHCSDRTLIKKALDWGIPSIMADGSERPFKENIDFVRKISRMSTAYNAAVEGELGLIQGSEEGVGTGIIHTKMTQPDQIAEFVRETELSHLAICIGNVHGLSSNPVSLDIPRLKQINNNSPVPLVLHGGSGLGANVIRETIRSGICKININSELRAIVKNIRGEKELSLPEQSKQIISAVKTAAMEKIIQFGPDPETKEKL